MRILAIRGENLASLAVPFDIDLDGGPLGATGIFAITGETGAGKSTILDALCLALYGQYPRVSAGRREDVPDPGGQLIGAGDPRAILRRGAGEGFAEVDFLGRDGVGYRARWTAFRARGKADGRLQNETRSLHRTADGAAVATGKTAVLTAVEAATDLTFEQFRRTVVLAQGEFDAFLLASEADRAELLEKITGTAVYSEISKRVHAGTDAQRAACAALVARHDAIGMLEDEGRAERLAERDAIDEGMPGLLAEQAALAAALDHSRRLSEAELLLAAAITQAGEAASAVEAGRTDGARLAELDAVEPLRSASAALATAQATVVAAEELRDRALADVEAAASGLDEARAGHAAAQVADEVGEADLRAFTPIWSAADGLDALIVELARDAQANAARAREAATALEAFQRRHAEIVRAHDATVASLDETARRIADDAAAALLADRSADIASLFKKRVAVVAEVEAAHAALAQAEAAIATADTATAAARDRAASARTARAGHIVARAALDEECRGLDAEAAETRLAHVRDLLERLAVASDVAGRHGRASAEHERASAGREQATAARDGAAARQAAAMAARDRATRARAEVAAMADLAERSASAEAAHLRIALVPGEPCPVCGSANHPITSQGRGSDELSRLAEAMRERRAAVEAELHQAGTDVATAIAEGASARARMEASARELDSAEVSLAEADRAYADLLPDLMTGCVAAGMPDVPRAVSDAGTVADLAMIANSARTVRKTLAGIVERARVLSGEIRALSQGIEAAEGEIVAADGIVLAEAGPRQAAALAAERERTRAAGLADRVVSLDRELGAHLADAGIDPADTARDPEGTASLVAEMGDAFRELRDRHRALETERNDIAPRRAVAIENLAAATRARDETAKAATARAEALDDARRDRADLLDGEATDIHRARVTAARETARSTLAKARETVGTASAAHAAATGALGHSGDQIARAMEAMERARARFGAECGEREPEAVQALLAVPPGTREALREARDRLLRTHEAAATALATRRADIDTLRARPSIDVPETEVAAERVAGLITDRQRRRGALDADLARDDEARAQAQNLAGEIEAAREGLAQWEAVNAAVGSVSGDRFRRFAQGVTLEHLAQLANEQLRMLSPRYALVRSRASDLSLHILDREMGDELRGTRSLSGGERFLVALALALALSGLEGRQNFVDTLFIDEGFGSLDAETLDVAVDALETLQGQGRRVGVITHVAAMIDRIAVQVRVERRGHGRSVVRVSDGASSPTAS